MSNNAVALPWMMFDVSILNQSTVRLKPGIIEGCLRAADNQVADAAARAVDKGIVGFKQASYFPDLIEPGRAPKTCFDSPDPYAVVTAALFRPGDSKAIEKMALALKEEKMVDEALARLS